MPQSLSSILTHLVFSTKNREPLLTGDVALDTVIASIKNQPEHHRRFSFQEEYRRLLERYQITYDERYVWD